MMAEFSETNSLLQLGFAGECQAWKLESRFFPSKIGGKPAWLDLCHLPTDEEMSCEKCGKPCILLCQIYAPIDDRYSCFHRSLFVFFCREADCNEENDNRNLKIFRCQLPRANDFYPYEPPVEEEYWRPDIRAEQFNNLCYVCGNKSLSKCGRCKLLFYCCKEHQKIHWLAGHRAVCSPDLSADQIDNRCTDFILKEFEILIESETSDEVHPGKSEEDSMKEYADLVLQGKAGSLHGDASVDQDLSAMALKEDKIYDNFKKKTSVNPDQVLRYDRGREPLWVSRVNIPKESDIPLCQICNSKRHFEFQILPQMLNHLNLDDVGKSIDWGTLVIYTCSNSCDQGPAYKKEFVWKQDFASDDA